MSQKNMGMKRELVSKIRRKKKFHRQHALRLQATLAEWGGKALEKKIEFFNLEDFSSMPWGQTYLIAKVVLSFTSNRAFSTSTEWNFLS